MILPTVIDKNQQIQFIEIQVRISSKSKRSERSMFLYKLNHAVNQHPNQDSRSYKHANFGPL